MRDADVCPTCGGVNDCGMEKGASTCWCLAMPHVVVTREARGIFRVSRSDCVRRSGEVPIRDVDQTANIPDEVSL
jgi:hypothetical protein